MNHARITPHVARTPGGTTQAVAVDETLPPLLDPGSVTVAVLDTGIDVDDAGRPNPWFGDHVDFAPGQVDPLGVGVGAGHGYLAVADGHGTFVTGRILHEAPTARIRMFAVLDKETSDSGPPIVDGQAVAEVLEELAAMSHDSAPRVVNMSFGGEGFENLAVTRRIATALESLIGAGVAVVASAGNDGGEQLVWPAAFEGVIAVGALDGRRLRPAAAVPPPLVGSDVSSWVNVYADGAELLGPFVTYQETAGLSATPFRPDQHFTGWAQWSGSSFAAATVSGRIAQAAIDAGCSGTQAAATVIGHAQTIVADTVWVR